MLLWPAAAGVFAVYNVFQSSGLDYRLVAAGALLPLVVDLPAGEQSTGHALATPTAILVATMLLTAGRGRRLARRRLIGLPIGWYAGLVLLGAWREASVFWWPLSGASDGPPLLAPVPVLVILELLGAAALRWIWVRFGLSDPQRRRRFARSGRLTLAAP
jgi:hypothetical protein